MLDTISFARGAPSPDLIPVDAVRAAAAKKEALEGKCVRVGESPTEPARIAVEVLRET